MSLLTAWLPGALRAPFLRLAGFELARGARIGFGAIVAAGTVRLGEGARVLPLTLVVADTIELGPRARVGPVSMVRVRRLRVGAFGRIGALVIAVGRERYFQRSELSLGVNGRIFPLCWLDCGQRVHVGNDSCLGGATHVFTHGSFLSYLEGFPVKTGDVFVGDNVYIAWRCVLLPGTHVAGDAVVGAKALVRGSFERGVLIAGSPAKILRQPYPPTLSADERRARLLEVLGRIADTIEESGVPVERETTSEDEVVIVWRPGTRREARLVWHRGREAPPAPPGTIVVVDGQAPPRDGAYVDASRRRYRLTSREAALGRVVRRVFHYHGIRLIEDIEDLDPPDDPDASAPRT